VKSFHRRRSSFVRHKGGKAGGKKRGWKALFWRRVSARNLGQAIRKISRRPPTRVLTLNNIAFRNTGGRWKGLDNSYRNYFVGRFKAYLKIRRSGRYAFKTTSNDGSRLYIDGKQVVNNDGIHGMRSRVGRVNLKKGKHTIVVDFFEYRHSAGLYVRWAGPGIRGWRLLDGAYVSHEGIVQTNALLLTQDELKTEVLSEATKAEEEMDESAQETQSVGEPHLKAADLRESASSSNLEPVELS
jgi:hypothetical protein